MIILDQHLPASLAERRRWVVAPDQTDHPPGEMVLYWMHNAVRGHENPALDAAIWLAHSTGLPLLVYHGLSENYPYASDRHHAFIMQGARDVQRELKARGISYAFHLERPGHRGPHLKELCRRAAVLVSEEMPVAPITGWIERLRSLVTTPILLVDTSCVVPTYQVESVSTHAFEFRRKTEASVRERIERPYQEPPVNLSVNPFAGKLDFEPLDLQDVSIADLIGQCKIDHSVGPVADTPGGTRAGYARWNQFRDSSLSSYAQRRNNAAEPLALSRMSAYLHYGMVSPFRIAREAASVGARKYLDELVNWREMTFRFCMEHHEELDTMSVIPDWASESLQQHRNDPRPETLSWESLARGQSSQSLWNTAQRSLLRHGELHNNLRMTWGKSFLSMTRRPDQALAHCIDLNHRYALDGRSPISYSGILWCFGQFDRPIEPELPVSGSVRPRSIDSHRRRLDVSKVKQWVNRPIAKELPRVAVIGAGLAGLIAARTLADHGLSVRVFEKSRGVGGRLATRRTESVGTFDHGAQYFTVRDDRFARYVRSWMETGLVQPWMHPIVELEPGGKVISEKRGTPRYVGVPGMNAIAKHLASDLDIVQQTEIESLNQIDRRWEPRDSGGKSHGAFDCVLINCPPRQAAKLLRGHTDLETNIDGVDMLPCWSMMMRCEGASDLPYAGAFINEGPLSWIGRNDTKPGRAVDSEAKPDSSWVLHASAEWSRANLERDGDWVGEQLLAAFESSTGTKLTRLHHGATHRWRYANPPTPLPDACLWDATTQLGACGDWCGGPRVEGAFLSGAAMAGTVLRHATIDRAATASSDKLAVKPRQTVDAD